MLGKLFINNEWLEGEGESFTSYNPANQQILWQGKSASEAQINNAVQAAKESFKNWSALEFNQRLEILNRFQTLLIDSRHQLVETLSQEIGKPLWDSNNEIEGMINKLNISVEAYHERCKFWAHETKIAVHKLRHKPHGALCVFGPFNFPAHLPNGHIIPALLAGNTIVFKPSELAPFIAEKMIQLWEKAHLPKGVINLVQGTRETGRLLSQNKLIDGLLFTGSFNTGVKISKQLSETPEKILALEMGGNNPLIVYEINNQIDAAVYYTIQSAYISAGQRCTCARRLIVVKTKDTDNYINRLTIAVKNIKVGSFQEQPEPFMGPVISKEAGANIINQYEDLLAQGAKVLVPLQTLTTESFLSPGLIDVTDLKNIPDQEIFGPLLKLHVVDNFDQALSLANDTQYGLAAGLLSEKEQHYLKFVEKINAGVISWNRPLTGASSKAPFGGIKHSGNHRPAAFYAADYCTYPLASTEAQQLNLPQNLAPGIIL